MNFLFFLIKNSILIELDNKVIKLIIKIKFIKDNALIKSQKLVKSYKKSRRQIDVIKGIDLKINAGDFVAITGASGSGKSTLLHLLAGLEKPTSGELLINGQNILQMSDAKLSQFRNQTVGFVFQSFYVHDFLTVEQNILVPAMFNKMPIKDRQQRVKFLLEQVGLTKFAKYYPKELSGGQIQRIAIARALINQPKIIFADEPTGNLDSQTSEYIINLLKLINQKLGTTVVMVTHDLEIAKQTDYQIKIKDGEIDEN